MFGVLFSTRWHRQLFPALLGAFFVFATTPAFAQSTVGMPANAATGSSLADAIRQNDSDLISREVLDRAAGTGTGTRAGSVGAFASGRLRTSDHDGLRPRSDTTPAYETDEASVFANVVTTLPGTVLGGQLKLSGFAGHNWLSLDLRSNALAVLDPNQSGSAENGSFLAGGTILWALQNTYALATVVGTWGETRLKDGFDDCGHASPPHPTGCNTNRYKYDTAGFIGTLTAGHVLDLAGPSGPKVDLRGSLGYIVNQGDPFRNVFGDKQEFHFSTWTGTAAVTLFQNMRFAQGAVLRPYIQGYVRREWDYRNEITATRSDGVPLGTTPLDQRHLYGGVDTGLSYVQGNMTLGAAIYYEASGDERTLGGRVGMSWLLN